MIAPTRAVTPATITTIGRPIPAMAEPHVNRRGCVDHGWRSIRHRRRVNRGRRGVNRRVSGIDRRRLINDYWRAEGYTKAKAKMDSGLGYRYSSDEHSS